jgi:hypothetical protein
MLSSFQVVGDAIRLAPGDNAPLQFSVRIAVVHKRLNFAPEPPQAMLLDRGWQASYLVFRDRQPA